VIPTTIVSLLASCFLSQAQTQPGNPTSVVATIESLQHDIKDFRAEFEGTVHYLNPEVQKRRNLKGDGLYDRFSGLYVWRTGGDTYVDCLHAIEPEGKIARKTLIVRPREHQAEVYTRDFDAPLGAADIRDSRSVTANGSGSLGKLFLIDEIKRLATRDDLGLTLSEETSDGKSLMVLTFRFKSNNRIFEKFWVDMRRSGHVVRRESYSHIQDAAVLMGREDIRLARFQIGSAEVWMPVFGKSEGHAAIKDGKPFVSPEPTSSETIYINDGTLQFNLNPNPETFRHTYKLGTPISDSLRRTQTTFGYQKAPPRQTKAEVETMLRDQVAAAQAQKKELVASSPARSGPGLAAWLPWVFGLGLIGGSGALLWQNRRHRGR